MSAEDARLSRLTALIDGSIDELDVAIPAWETSRRPDGDSALISRMNGARLAAPFQVVREALHVQVIMALARLWDADRRDGGSIGFELVSTELRKGDVRAALRERAEAACALRLAETRDARTGQLLSVSDPDHHAWLRQRLPSDIAAAIAAQNTRVEKWCTTYTHYRTNRIQCALAELWTLRNKRVGHRQLSDLQTQTTRTYRIHNLGRILRASELLTEGALLCVKDEHYRFSETHRMYARAAGSFWSALPKGSDSR
ncbi:hypothetical protein [Roseomonas sp. CECT 9278]|uniref:hypothetical protein n=1 Tax=Roseomonas sp. CECT 9278 TaxID=2845823 RepID=UPI001E641C6E|nr:hypothetical protein [Roseomonas sp. CECT 9278]CAH0143336.1 hypothetical protein ROS9278_00531 [Roseomonas sp. CECT 9278]